MVSAGDDQQVLFTGAGGIVFIGHAYRYKIVICAVDKQHRHFALLQYIYCGALPGAYADSFLAKIIRSSGI